mmetsp:Transcript_5574/g.14557  ORF Transcript_5574/g.14557 Transcript_5574/m.14557 type:complete len:136 (+) Transcript_5574:199-606(+)
MVHVLSPGPHSKVHATQLHGIRPPLACASGLPLVLGVALPLFLSLSLSLSLSCFLSLLRSLSLSLFCPRSLFRSLSLRPGGDAAFPACAPAVTRVVTPGDGMPSSCGLARTLESSKLESARLESPSSCWLLTGCF